MLSQSQGCRSPSCYSGSILASVGSGSTIQTGHESPARIAAQKRCSDVPLLPPHSGRKVRFREPMLELQRSRSYPRLVPRCDKFETLGDEDTPGQRTPNCCCVLPGVLQGLARIPRIGVVQFAVEQGILVVLVNIDLPEIHIHGRREAGL